MESWSHYNRQRMIGNIIFILVFALNIYPVRKLKHTFSFQAFLYSLWYFTFSILGNFNNFFFAAHLLDVAVGFKTLRTILQSVTHNGKQVCIDTSANMNYLSWLRNVQIGLQMTNWFLSFKCNITYITFSSHFNQTVYI